MAQLVTSGGVVVFTGTIVGIPAAGIPQGGPLTADLLAGDHSLTGAADGGGATGGSVFAGNGQPGGGGAASAVAGNSPDTSKTGAGVTLFGATNAAHGLVQVVTGGTSGVSGLALVSDGAAKLVYGGAIFGAGAPGAAPAGKLPLAVDTTPGTGGLYVWDGNAWIKVSALP